MAERATASTNRGLALMARLAPTSQRDLWPLLLAACAVLFIAEIGTARVPGAIAAACLGLACVIGRPFIASAVVIVGANDPHLFRDSAIESVTPIDVAIVATLVRTAISADRRRPTLLELCAFGFLLAAGVATVVAHGSSAVTAYGRVASYLLIGLAVGRALTPGERPQLGRAFVGAQIGQAAAAIAGLTPSAPTAFPLGRYLGTLGDPAQFGIPVAFAGVLAATTSQMIRFRYVRYAVAGLLCVGVAGSVTRSAWAVLGTGFLLTVVTRAAQRRSMAVRLALAASGVVLASLATAAVVIEAGPLGLTKESADIRGISLDAAWTHLLAHPFRPEGLGSHSVVPREPTVRGDPVFASSFEHRGSAWRPFRAATLHRARGVAAFGRASLMVVTHGRTEEEGVYLPMIGGLQPGSSYTFSLSAQAQPGLPLWLYVDEYDRTNHWRTYKYVKRRGTGRWQRYSLTWQMTPNAAHVVLYALVGPKIRTSFNIDGAKLNAGREAQPFVAGEKPPPVISEVSEIYNTWLAVAIELGIVAAVVLAVLATGAPLYAYRLGDKATAFALAALLVPSMTEDFVYGASLVTLTWFAALGLAVTAGKVRRHDPQ
jgi:Carbohydrate binding domain